MQNRQMNTAITRKQPCGMWDSCGGANANVGVTTVAAFASGCTKAQFTQHAEADCHANPIYTAVCKLCEQLPFPEMSPINYLHDAFCKVLRVLCKWALFLTPQRNSPGILENWTILLQEEIEKLRVELSTDGNTAAQALLSSKVEQLRMQMENMQVFLLPTIIKPISNALSQEDPSARQPKVVRCPKMGRAPGSWYGWQSFCGSGMSQLFSGDPPPPPMTWAQCTRLWKKIGWHLFQWDPLPLHYPPWLNWGRETGTAGHRTAVAFSTASGLYLSAKRCRSAVASWSR